MSQRTFNALFLGDLIGQPGFRAVFFHLPQIVKRYSIDFVVANAENAASDGLGLLPEHFDKLREIGVDVVTTGNHVWEKKEIFGRLDSEDRLLRPLNYPSGLPGHGSCVVQKGPYKIAVLNVQGRQSLAMIDDPFSKTSEALKKLKRETPIVFIDFHAEASEEKEAFGFHVDGAATAVVGTHTHIQTADERLLPQGTAYISDLGMCGPLDSVIGSDPAVSVEKSLTMLPLRNEILDAPACVQGAVVRVDAESGKAISIERIRVS